MQLTRTFGLRCASSTASTRVSVGMAPLETKYAQWSRYGRSMAQSPMVMIAPPDLLAGHDQPRAAGAQERAQRIRVEIPPQVGRRDLLQRNRLPDRRRGDQHIQPSESLQHASEHAVHRRFVPDVGLKRCAGRSACPQLCNSGLCRLGRRVVVQSDRIAALGQRVCHHIAHTPPAAAGDQGDWKFVFGSPHGSLSCGRDEQKIDFDLQSCPTARRPSSGPAPSTGSVPRTRQGPGQPNSCQQLGTVGRLKFLPLASRAAATVYPEKIAPLAAGCSLENGEFCP